MIKKLWWLEEENRRGLVPSEVDVPLLNLSGVFPPGMSFTTDEISDSDWNYAREQAWAIRERLTEEPKGVKK